MQPPTQLHQVNSHSYDVLSPTDDLIALLDVLLHPLGPPRAGDLYLRRWRHDGPAGRTVVILFDDTPARLVVMGPRVESIDALVGEGVAA